MSTQRHVQRRNHGNRPNQTTRTRVNKTNEKTRNFAENPQLILGAIFATKRLAQSTEIAVNLLGKLKTKF